MAISLILSIVIGLILLVMLIASLVTNKARGIEPKNRQSHTRQRDDLGGTNKTPSIESAGRRPESRQEDDYDRWVSVLKTDKPKVHEFYLHGTRAAVLWKESDPEVSVVCITQFSDGIPKTKKYDHFEFNIKEWYWYAIAPRGSAGFIKEKLEELFRAKVGA